MAKDLMLAGELLPQKPAVHIPLGPLPADGAWTMAQAFELPASWTGLTFCGAYTADAQSINARPKWRVVWTDGVRDYPHPIESSVLDTSEPPIAYRDRYDVQDRVPVVAPGTTIAIAVPIARMPGMERVRLDMAEHGDQANPGTVVIDTIVGG